VKRAAGRLARGLLQGPGELLDPSPRLLSRRLASVAVPPIAVVSVYRRRFAGNLQDPPRDPAGGTAGWPSGALTGQEPALATETIGTGPGERFDLLNRLLRHLDLPHAWWVLVCDDDVRLKRGGPDTLAAAAVCFGFELCQPANAWNSEVSHPFTRRRALMLARRTTWVEQGPMVLFGPAARSRLLPFPADVRWPGWGIEAGWSRQERLGLGIGIVDGVTMVHQQPVNASGYAVTAAREQEHRLRRRAGFAPGRSCSSNASTGGRGAAVLVPSTSAALRRERATIRTFAYVAGVSAPDHLRGRPHPPARATRCRRWWPRCSTRWS
jgi:hypothetical protein